LQPDGLPDSSEGPVGSTSSKGPLHVTFADLPSPSRNFSRSRRLRSKPTPPLLSGGSKPTVSTSTDAAAASSLRNRKPPSRFQQ
jgi:hypothetical protein